MSASLRPSKACQLLFFCGLFVMFSPILRNYTISPTDVNSSTIRCRMSDFLAVYNPLAASYRRCLLTQLNKTDLQIWTNLHSAVDSCWRQNALRTFLPIRRLSNLDETKAVVLPYSTAKDDKCISVTLGIGRDIRVERKLRHHIWNCRFFGADPIEESGRVFRAMGRYLPIAVGARNGFYEASVLENGDYSTRKVRTTSLDQFLRTYVGENLIDYLFMDNEGPEFEIFRKYFAGLRKETDAKSWPFDVCQIAVEMHAPLEKYGMNHSMFNDLMLKILIHSDVLPIWSLEPNQHIRSTYLNVRNEECLRKYVMDRFCQ